MADIKPVYKYTNGEWQKQKAYQYTSGRWIEISSKESPQPEPTPTPELVYTLSSDGTYYIVGTGFTSIEAINQDTSGGNGGSGLNSNWTGGDLVIPATYNNKPVLAIAPKAFYNVNNIDSVYVYNGITTIGHRAFQSYPNESRLKTFQLPSSVINLTPSSGRLLWGRAGLESAIISGNILNGNLMDTFYECHSLTNLDLSGFNTSNVTDMRYMFYYCSSLKSLDVSKFNTSDVTNMSGMFDYCSGLTSLDLSNFNTSNVTDMGYMFFDCHSLTNLDLSGFNTSKVTDMSSMFANVQRIQSLDLSNFTSNNSPKIDTMFYGCTSLNKIDIRNFDFSKVTSYENAFGGGVGLLPSGCLIIVKDNTQKTWITSRFSRLTNVKTVAEYEAE